MRKIKLLRDKRAGTPATGWKGEPYRVVEAPDEIMNLLLVGKVHEEIEEVREHLTDEYEYADVLTALRALAKRNGVKWHRVLQAAARKSEESGGFTKPRVMVKD